MKIGMKIEEIHDECKKCIHLRAWNLRMSGDHDYSCRKKPDFCILKSRHKEPCDKFMSVDDMFLERTLEELKGDNK